MRKYLLYGHGGSENHGCEALVRTTIALMDKNKDRVVLSSYNPHQDYMYNIDDICCIKKRGEKKYVSKLRPSFIKAYYDLVINKNALALDKLYELNALGVSKGNVAISIGGDNYCYDGVETLRLENELYRSAKLKTVLWGCSIEPTLLKTNSSVVEDLKRFDLITARESISYNAIKEVNPNTLLVCDSAFFLEKKELPLPKTFHESELVGINAGPLIENYGKNCNLIRTNFCNLIEKILKETDMKILLIPHVVCCTTDDRVPLKILYEKYKHSGRVYMIEDGTCEELKGYIARCRYFIGARTHATIAAYSSCVPTLVLGYSVKSKGIAKDLFGTYDDYVIPVQELKTPFDLARGFTFLMNNESEIKNTLQKIMPSYKAQIQAAIEKLKYI